MAEKKGSNVQRSVRFIPLKVKLLGIGFLSVLMTAALISGIIVWKTRQNSKLEIAQFQDSILKNRKQELASITDTAYSALVSAYNDAHNEERIRSIVAEKLKASLDVLYSSIENEYLRARASGSAAEMKRAKARMIKEIQKLRFGETGKDYVWIHSFDSRNIGSPRMIMHPTVPKLNGRDISEYLYSDGPKKGQIVYATGVGQNVPFFQQMNVVVSESGSGFVGYEWPKPTSTGLTEHQPKLSYVRLFKPWGWVIGTGAYLSAVESKVQDDIARMIGSIRYGDDKKGYFWIHSYDMENINSPNMIMHPTVPALNGKNISNYKYTDGPRKGQVVLATGISESVPFFQQMNRAVSKNGSGFIGYEWPKPTKEGLTEHQPKMSYVRLFEQWGWVIGTGVYMDEIELMRSKKETQLNTEIGEFIVMVIFISALTITLSLAALFFVAKIVTKPVEENTEFFKDMAEGKGDLTRRMKIRFNDETGEMAKWFNTFAEKIQGIIEKISGNSDIVASSSEELAATVNQVNASVMDETRRIDQVAVSATEMSQTILDVAKNAGDAAKAASEAADAAVKGREVVDLTTSGMHDIARSVGETAHEIEKLGQSSQQISEIINVINDIADQTNLLALNAAIEAARAGEHGRGFAVVADEVRKLAERTGKATGEISDMVIKIQGDTESSVKTMNFGRKKAEEGMEVVKGASEALDKIVEASNSCLSMVSTIAAATEEQSTAVEEVSDNMETVLQISKNTSDAMGSISNSAQDLSNISQELRGLVSMFKVR